MIKAVAFDLDGMVFVPREYFSDQIAKELDVPREKILEFFKNELVACQKGKLDMKQVLEEKYFPAWGWTKGFDKFTSWWFEGEEFNKQVVKLALKLKMQGVMCVLVSNNEKYRLEHLISNFKLDELFDHVLLPYEIGAIKPEREIFQAILDTTYLEPHEVVACDHEEEKLSGAKELGMKILLAEDVESLEKGLIKR